MRFFYPGHPLRDVPKPSLEDMLPIDIRFRLSHPIRDIYGSQPTLADVLEQVRLFQESYIGPPPPDIKAYQLEAMTRILQGDTRPPRGRSRMF